MWWGWGGKGLCVPYVKHVLSTSVECEHQKAIYLFQVTPALLVVPFFLEQTQFALNACAD